MGRLYVCPINHLAVLLLLAFPLSNRSLLIYQCHMQFHPSVHDEWTDHEFARGRVLGDLFVSSLICSLNLSRVFCYVPLVNLSLTYSLLSSWESGFKFMS